MYFDDGNTIMRQDLIILRVYYKNESQKKE